MRRKAKLGIALSRLGGAVLRAFLEFCGKVRRGLRPDDRLRRRLTV
jgi:hypothetical protein